MSQWHYDDDNFSSNFFPDYREPDSIHNLCLVDLTLVSRSFKISD